MSDLLRNQFLTGNAVDVLKTLPDNSIHAVVTSPPYFGLRSYCEKSSLEKQYEIGCESSPEQYVENLVSVFREVKRVLHTSGTLWVNIGDSYWGSWGNSGNRPELDGQTQNQREKNLDYINRRGWDENRVRPPTSYRHSVIKSKDLIGIPWMLAFALRADGWYLRSDIIWSKPNPLPESVEDRVTRSHEYIFMLTKSARYYYDRIAISEPISQVSIDRINQKTFDRQHGGEKDYLKTNVNTNRSMRKTLENFSANTQGTRNKRSVWAVSTKPYREAHFATFNISLIDPMILAGTSAKGCCPKCGAPWQRVVVKTDIENTSFKDSTFDKGKTGVTQGDRVQAGPRFVNKEVGWEPTCKCGETKTVPSVILDPFMGAGTSAICARKNNRDFIGIDLNPKYVELAQRRHRRFVGQGIHNEDKPSAPTEKLDDLFSDLI